MEDFFEVEINETDLFSSLDEVKSNAQQNHLGDQDSEKEPQETRPAQSKPSGQSAPGNNKTTNKV
jgi:hypothetical protein